MNKTERKNTRNSTVNWPDAGKIFDVTALSELNKDMPLITLRVKLGTARDNNIVETLGTVNVGKGRPKLMFTMYPASQEVKDMAVKMEISPLDKTSLSKHQNTTDQIPVNNISDQPVHA